MIEAADLLFERKIVKVLQKIVAYYPVGTKIRLNIRRNRNRCMPDGQFYPSGRCCLRSG